MNTQETMNFIHETSWKGSQLGLERITDLMHLLGDPQDELRFIHIAGTNGKGSTAAMLASVLKEAGYRTGLYTSPYIYRFNERMNVNGADITDDELSQLAEKLKTQVEKMNDKPTEFEIITAMAFLYFLKKDCDVVVLEVGLGGRLDSTNIIKEAEVSLITSIDFDHMEVLGDTLPKIAAEKAGIIKPDVPVVLYNQCKEVTDVIQNKCKEHNAPLTITDETLLTSNADSLLGQNFDYRQRKDITIPLAGKFQLYNAAAVLDTLDALKAKGCHISEKAIMDGLAKTEWPGRFEVLSKEPLVIVDGAHNPNGVQALTNCLKEYLSDRKICFVIGVMADKDFSGMIRAVIPYAKSFVTVTPKNPRALSSALLKQSIEEVFAGEVTDAGSAVNGVKYAMEHCKDGEAICAFGSLYMIGTIREFFGMYEQNS